MCKIKFVFDRIDGEIGVKLSILNYIYYILYNRAKLLKIKSFRDKISVVFKCPVMKEIFSQSLYSDNVYTKYIYTLQCLLLTRSTSFPLRGVRTL